jgi:hypothetical protein
MSEETIPSSDPVLSAVTAVNASLKKGNPRDAVIAAVRALKNNSQTADLDEALSAYCVAVAEEEGIQAANKALNVPANEEFKVPPSSIEIKPLSGLSFAPPTKELTVPENESPPKEGGRYRYRSKKARKSKKSKKSRKNQN